ncbi:MAG TPA: MarR family transcriptional regulator, partial [Dehalococcoidales bacterium]|nr:MarR family transcriptional regulator [Dehalococcoidales bacterium]
QKSEAAEGSLDKTALKTEIMEAWKYIGRHIRGSFTEAWMELNLTIAQLKCLFYIDGEGSTNQKSLASVLGVTPPNVTGIIDRLVEQQLVTRKANAANRRMQIIELTPKSKNLLSELKERRVSVMGSMLEKMSYADLQALLRGLKALHQVELEYAKNQDF